MIGNHLHVTRHHLHICNRRVMWFCQQCCLQSRAVTVFPQDALAERLNKGCPVRDVDNVCHVIVCHVRRAHVMLAHRALHALLTYLNCLVVMTRQLLECKPIFSFLGISFILKYWAGMSWLRTLEINLIGSENRHRHY